MPQGRYPQYFPQDQQQQQQQHQSGLFSQSLNPKWPDMNSGANASTLPQQYANQAQGQHQQSSLFAGSMNNQTGNFPPLSSLTHASPMPNNAQASGRPAFPNNFLSNSTDPAWGSALARPGNISNDLLGSIESIIEPSADPFANRALADPSHYYPNQQHHQHNVPATTSPAQSRNAPTTNPQHQYNMPRVSPQNHHQSPPNAYMPQIPQLVSNHSFNNQATGGYNPHNPDPFNVSFHGRAMPQQARPSNIPTASFNSSISSPAPPNNTLTPSPAATPPQQTPAAPVVEKVKRPVNSYFLFSQTRGKELRRMDPTMTTATVSRLLSDEWKRLDPIEKDSYVQRAKEMKAEFVKEHPEYVWGRVKGEKKKDDGSGKRKKGPDDDDSDEVDDDSDDAASADGKTKKPMNAFLVFNQEMRPQLQQQLQMQAGAGQKSSFTVSDISRLIGEQWRGLGPDEKQRYVTKSKQLKEEYERMKALRAKKKKRATENNGVGDGKKDKGSKNKPGKAQPYPSPEERLTLGEPGLFDNLMGYPTDNHYGAPSSHHTGLPSPISPAGSPPSSSKRDKNRKGSTNTNSTTNKKDDKKKKKKDKGGVKKPTGSFLYYLAEVRPAYTARFPGCTVGVISQKISAAWKELGPEERRVYNDRAKQDKIRYLREKEERERMEKAGMV
ncbi:Protein SOX-15 [Rhizophlyctis rosea]|nr:Protein SOX-15 [Rhizophlyctis rosea]